MKINSDELETIRYFEDKIKGYRQNIDMLREEEQEEGHGTMIDVYKLEMCMIIKNLNIIKRKNKMINFILNDQIENGYLVNFNNLEEAYEFYERKLENEQ